MPDRREYILHYSKYFGLEAPSIIIQTLIIVLIGAVAGAIASTVIHYSINNILDYKPVLLGACFGVIVISIPAFLTVILLKATKKKMRLKHALLSVILIISFYAALFIANATLFALLRNYTLAYVILLVSNAGIYGYWFVMGRIVIGEGKSVAITAAIHPIISVLFYLPFSSYLLGISSPVNVMMVKLIGGMATFLIASYLFFYLIDRPSKKLLDVSGIKVLSSMLSYWMYNLTNDIKIIGDSIGRKRKAEIDILALKGRKGYKALFVNPDIHFGPLMNFGGSIAPKHIGDALALYGAAPFVLHTAIGIEDNPINTFQVYRITKEINSVISGGMQFKPARGFISSGRSGRCRAIEVKIGSVLLMTLTKAPYVTEDMGRDIGIRFKIFASHLDKRDAVIIIDAHNSRFESASAKELSGIDSSSAYILDYEAAISSAMKHNSANALRFGTAYKKLREILGVQNDLGEGYTSVGIFEFGKERFCMIYFDANNMLPGFREEIIAHVKEKFGLWAELYTTDTHAINTVALDSSNSLGRYTRSQEIIPVLDLLVGSAIGNIEPVSYAYKKLSIKDCKVWGYNADVLIEKTSKEVRRTLMRIVPFLITGAFIIAAWVISVI